MPMIKSIALYSITLAVLSACVQSNPNENSNSERKQLAIDSIQKELLAKQDSIRELTQEKSSAAQKQKAQYSKLDTYGLLVPGSFSIEEIPNVNDSLIWYGIFETNDTVAIKPVTYTLKKLKDPMWEDLRNVTIEENATGLVFMLSAPFLSDTMYQSLNVLKDIYGNEKPIRPDGYSFTIGNVNYHLSYKEDDIDYEEAQRQNVDIDKLDHVGILTCTEQQAQEQAQTFTINAAGMKLLWIGDINKDAIPDVLMNNNYYGSTEYVLYLSGGKQWLTKSFAVKFNVGC